MQIPKDVYEKLKREGYNDKEIAEAYQNLQEEQGQRPERYEDETPATTFTAPHNENLVKWQLDVAEMLEKAEHLLREDIVTIENGQTVWKTNPNPEKRTFSKQGIQEMLKILTMYLNRMTILSDYTDEEINDKVYDFGRELNDLIFMKYEEFGLNTSEKRKNYPMLVREMVDLVHSAFNRARYGGERKSLRSARQTLQQERISSGDEDGDKRGMLNPMRYIGGKYK